MQEPIVLSITIKSSSKILYQRYGMILDDPAEVQALAEIFFSILVPGGPLPSGADPSTVLQAVAETVDSAVPPSQPSR